MKTQDRNFATVTVYSSQKIDHKVTVKGKTKQEKQQLHGVVNLCFFPPRLYEIILKFQNMIMKIIVTEA